MDGNRMGYYKELLVRRMRDSLHREHEEGLKKIYDATDNIPDASDIASLETMRNVAFIIGDVQRQRIREIQEALARIDLGEFGQCERCGCGISEGRLTVNPTTKLCIRCKKREEEQREYTAA